MITIQQLASALYGTWLLVKLDSRAFAYFERTPAGFARSFLAALALAPLQLGHDVLAYSNETTRLGFGPYVLVRTLAYVIGWVLFPFIMLYMTRLLGREIRYLTYMVPYNWFQLAFGAVLGPIPLMADSGVLSPSAADTISYLLLPVFLVYGTFIARLGLAIGIGTAIGVVLLDFLVSLITGQVIAQI
jgi:hypothetical protein